MSRRVAIREWAPAYRRSWLRLDLVAGFTVAAVLIPSAIAYAAIVGVEPIVGLYTVPLALVAYAVFGGSRLLVVGPDAAISVLSASTVAAVAGGGDYLELTIGLSLLVAAFYLLFSALRMGWVADLVPDPVLRGFIQGLVWVTILGQIPALVGVELAAPAPDFWRRAADVVGALDDVHVPTLVLGIASLTMLVVIARVAPRIPGPLVVLVGSMFAVAGLGLAGDGVAVVGEPSGGLFGFGVPNGVSGGQLVSLAPGALAIVVLGFTESMGAAKAAAQETGEHLDADEELRALGMSNLGAGLSGGYVVTGALSKTSVAIASGGRTQVGNLVAAALAVLSIIVLRPVFAQLAQSVLAALVIFAMAGMVEVRYYRRLWRISRRELLVALVAFLGVLTFGVLPGVVVGVVVSLVLLIEHIGRPAGIVLGRDPEGLWRDVDGVFDVQQIDGMVVFRQEAPLVFLNARRTSERIAALATEGVTVIVADATPTSTVDSTGFDAMLRTRDVLVARGVELWIVNPSIRKRLASQHAAGVLRVELPPVFPTIDAAAAAFDQRTPREQQPPQTGEHPRLGEA